MDDVESEELSKQTLNWRCHVTTRDINLERKKQSQRERNRECKSGFENHQLKIKSLAREHYPLRKKASIRPHLEDKKTKKR